MGFDPYWPTCLATINTTIVPATAILPERFDEIYQALTQQRCMPLSQMSKSKFSRNDLVNSSDYRQGSVFFDFGRSFSDNGTQALAFEPNSRTQLLIGIHDSSSLGQEDETNLDTALEALRTFAAARQRDVVCILLAFGTNVAESRSGIAVFQDSASESIEAGLQHAYSLWSKQVCRIADGLSPATLFTPANSETSNAVPPNEDVPRDADINTGKRRYTIVLGLLNLYTGAWPDALRRLSEGITLAREAGDPMWQARAIESLVLCMAFLVWQGSSFDLPSVCEQAYSTSQLMSKSIFARAASLNGSTQPKTNAALSSAQQWLKYAPVLLEAVLGVYEHVASFAEEDIPYIALTQSRIRTLNLLAFASRSHHDTLIEDLDKFLLEKQLPSSLGVMPSSAGIDIANQLSAALPTSEEALLTSDGVAATLAAVSCLSATGVGRRQAFMLRGLLQGLVPAISKARTAGAAEASVHHASTPAADSPRQSNVRVSMGLRSLALTTARSYGSLVSSSDDSGQSPILTKSMIEQNLVAWCGEHTGGDLPLKTDILLLCIALCESVGDIAGSSQLVSALLRLSVINPLVSLNSEPAKLVISANEQGRLLDRLKRWSENAESTGVPISTLSWDDFLVRDIQVVQQGSRPPLLSHAPNELSLVDEASGPQVRDPFIFNPFARSTTVQAAPVVAADETVVFSVQLQNPLEVPVDVSDIRLAAEGCQFTPTRHSVVLGPLSSQIFTLTGVASEAGTLKITGCKATVEGCQMQTFPTMKAKWLPPLKVKQQMSRSNQMENRKKFSQEEMKVADPFVLELTVIQRQPELEVASMSLTQTSLMLLEGEKRTFSLSVRNTSEMIPANLVLLTSNDNISRGLRESLSRKDLMAVDTYEVQHQLKHRQALQISNTAQQQNQIDAKETKEYEVDLFGRAGLSEASVHVDFAHLGAHLADIKQTFYTRQIRCPLALTVNGSIEVVRCNVLSVQGELPSDIQKHSKPGHSEHVNGTSWSSAPDGVCMLSLDLRNVWPQPLTVELQSLFDLEATPISEQNTYTAIETIQPGHVSRVILVIPRLFVENAFAPILNLDAKKQFVVDTSTMRPEAEAAMRENFWYREELLKHITGTWKEEKSGRQGEIDLRKGIRLNLNARMIDVLRVEHVEISYSLIADSEDSTENALRKLSVAHYQLQIESFATLHVKVRNRSNERLSLLLRLQPCLRDQPHNIALDLSRRLAWSGVLQQVLHPPLDPGEEREAKLGLLVLAAGLYEVSATVEEVKPRSKASTPTRIRLELAADRRIWHARMPCLIDAVKAIA
ncbi:Transport protein particle subunit [Cyphellophora attinorum]|uniref:Transport protein particle subunit n=1 Tax=Cyphellophora attinorum TaxID=1664694 RepID=A0A0N1HCD7_9EURO|nr:Transport protein particle subunit [Phialophora attinorum]KPI41433.1 Transport protein particle subunit [Phialophora attinorum]